MKRRKALVCGIIGLLLFKVLDASAALIVQVTSPKVIGAKAVIRLAMRNSFDRNIESARAICFLLDGREKIVGVATHWVIGGAKSRPALAPRKETTFNFVISVPTLLSNTNLTAKVTFNRLILQGGKSADVRRDVRITAAPKQPPVNAPRH